MTNIENLAALKFCLYARKSTESDEKQAMSIDSQVHEMKVVANNEHIHISDVYQESHSAKVSGTRPIFNQLIGDLRQGKFDGVLSWSPDRLSRNAGDLGILVDLMDQNKLQMIKTYSQTFTNNPNEKFLLMILCSQAKLENDNRGLHVKRGIRAACENGWRPTHPPLGYINRKIGNVKDVTLDEERAKVVKQIFERASKDESGRDIKRWLDSFNFLTRTDRPVTLSTVYKILNNTFYYGEFEYPVGSGKWYQGKHEPLITKGLFENVQQKMIVAKKGEWGRKSFVFKGFLRCGSCGSGTVAEEKFKKLKYGGYNHHVYYHCTHTRDIDCHEPYISEIQLTDQLKELFDNIRIDKKRIQKEVMYEIEKFQQLRFDVLRQEYLNGILEKFNYDEKKIDNQTICQYAKHVLTTGTYNQKRAIKSLIQGELFLKNGQILFKPNS